MKKDMKTDIICFQVTLWLSGKYSVNLQRIRTIMKQNVSTRTYFESNNINAILIKMNQVDIRRHTTEMKFRMS